MVRLSDIPPSILKQIERFVKENKGKIPVVSEGENLVDLVEKKFGYRLSPSQIYDLQRGYKTIRVKLDVDLVREIEKEYGSLGKGLRQLLNIYKSAQLPDKLKMYHDILKRKEEWTLDEIMDVLKPLCEDEQEVYKVIGELCKYNVVQRVGDKYKVFKIPVDPILRYFLG